MRQNMNWEERSLFRDLLMLGVGLPLGMLVVGVVVVAGRPTRDVGDALLIAGPSSVIAGFVYSREALIGHGKWGGKALFVGRDEEVARRNLMVFGVGAALVSLAIYWWA